MPNPTPSAKDIAEAQRVKAALERKRDALGKRKQHLEQSIADLPDDVEAGDATWFSDELRRTEAELKAIETRLTDIAAAAAATEINEKKSKRSELIEIYEEAVNSRTVHRLPDALRNRALEAVREEGERKLYATRD